MQLLKHKAQQKTLRPLLRTQKTLQLLLRAQLKTHVMQRLRHEISQRLQKLMLKLQRLPL